MRLTEWTVAPFLPTLKPKQQERVNAWLPVLEVILNERYGNLITEAREPVFISYAADAIMRKLDRSNREIQQQSIASASVRYDPRAKLTGWFYPSEIADMDSLVGLGAVRSARMSAPDGVRFGNLARGPLFDGESDDAPYEVD